ncbi:hypothetical protein QCA50_006490 [Cerrena zonata]|uniref:F-box domain-containing protein n=1 Tax=Cerrena zonata TaxID=2478898 RepID=A0AAW0GK11_9APHY
MSAIRAGLRGKDLISPLLRDCRGWMFMRPDIWPTPSEDEIRPILFQTFNSDGSEQTAPLVALLPTEIFQQILRDMSLSSLLNLSATCRMLRSVITEPSFLDLVLKEALRDGNLRWILPIESFRDEKQRAYEAVRLWIPDGLSSEMSIKDSTTNEESLSLDATSRSNALEIDMASIPSIESLILSPTFPRLAFIRACWDSDYMMNRKRIWEQVKQFEKLWIDYRINGWKVDRFFPSADILDKVDSF